MADAASLASNRLSSTFQALRYPNYRRWFVGQALSLMGTWMQSVASGWLVYQLTGSKLALGTISFAGAIPTFFLMLPAGAVVDRMLKRRLLLVTQSIMMLAAFAQAALAATGVIKVWHIGLISAVVGIANSFDAPARLSLAVEMVEDRRDLQNAIALNSTMFNLARIIGPAIGGLILGGLGAAWCFALNGASFLAVLVALWGMRLHEAVKPPRTGRLLSEVAEGLRFVRSQPAITALVTMVGVASIFGFSYAVLMPAYAVDVLGVDARGLGVLTTSVGIGALVASLIVATSSRSRRKGLQLTAGSLLFPLALLGLAFARTLPVALGCLMLVGLGFVSMNATSNTLVQTMVPDALRGRVMSVYTFMFFGTAPFGSLFSGALAEKLGPRWAIGIGAGIVLVCASLVAIFAPSVRRAEG